MDNEELNEVLQEINYEEYEKVFTDFEEKKIDIGLSNTACRQITQTEKPAFANFGIFIGIIPSIIITIYFSVISSNYFLLLIILLDLILPHTCYLFDNFKVKTRHIAYILLVIDFFIMKLPEPITVIYLSVICCSLGVKIWKFRLYKFSIKIMKKRTDAFVWAYNSHNLYIRDNNGTLYRKSF